MKYLFSILFALLSTGLMAQSPFSIHNSKGKSDASVEQVSLANPWIGAKLSYNLNDEAPLEDKFIFNAKILYTPLKGSNYAVPVVATAGLGDDNILSPESGINVGVYPYYILSKTEKVTIVAHGGIGYKVLSKNVEVDAEAPQQIRLVGGLEAAFYSSDKSGPTTLSITPAYLYNTLKSTPNTSVLEIDAIVPISSGLGLLISGQVPFEKQYNGSFKLGVIVNSQL